MVVLSVYFARSSVGTGICVVVGTEVSVGKGVIVAAGMDKAVGITVGTGAGDEQEDKNERRNRERTMRDEVILFRMG